MRDRRAKAAGAWGAVAKQSQVQLQQPIDAGANATNKYTFNAKVNTRG